MPPHDNLNRLAATLDVTTDFLLGRYIEPATLLADDPLVRARSRIGAQAGELIGVMLRVLVARHRSTSSPQRFP